MKLFVLFCACFVTSAWALSIPATRLKRDISSRIIGGNNAFAGQFPFVVAIEKQTSDGNYFCGGTLISNKWVLTAGQCVSQAVLFSIKIGSTSLINTDPNRIIVASSEYIVHPEYDELTLINDIGLIELRLPIEFSNYILAIHSLAENELESYTRVVSLGWGQTSDEDGELSNLLQYTTVTSLTNEECRLTYGNQIVDNMVCVDGNFNEGTCHGDTGTPLVLVIAMGNAQLVGVSSFISGNGCESTDPSGYTRIYPYRDWITTTTNNEIP